jgi:hypothetical protein
MRSDRKPLPEHLPREVVTHAPGVDSCSDCGGQLRHFGDDVSEQLEYVPDSFKDIYEAACWAHARRKFHEIHVVHASLTTTEALARIGALYAIPEEIRGKPADLRLSIHQARARPLLAELRAGMQKAQGGLSSKSETAGAICYALARWHALTRYADDGLLEIDNSAAERALRAVALGRKNFLFVGSDGGGQRAAAMYSLIGSAKINGLNPELYPLPCSPGSLITRSAASPTCCHGTWQTHSRHTLQKQPKTHSTGVRQKTSGHMLRHSLCVKRDKTYAYDETAVIDDFVAAGK